MGGLACALKQKGWQVSGSDVNTREPMRSFLAQCHLNYNTSYQSRNIGGDVEQVIVGKRIDAGNVELQTAIARGIPVASFPEFLEQQFLLHSRNLVVAGSLGKTTTTAMLTWILDFCGPAPNYLIGGLPRNLPMPARWQNSGLAVLEGDEYPSSYADPCPKFLHYRPEVAIITNIVPEHPDHYKDANSLSEAFVKLVKLLPGNGSCVVNEECLTQEIRASCRGSVLSVGFTNRADVAISQLRLERFGTCFEFLETEFRLRLFGRMNALDAAMSIVAAREFGIAPEQSAAALARFEGVRFRQDVLVDEEITVIADKATHPRSLAELFAAVRQQFPRRRIVPVIQPRVTGGRNWIYQQELPDSLDSVDAVVILKSRETMVETSWWQDEPFSFEQLSDELQAGGRPVRLVEEIEQLTEILPEVIQQHDVVVLSILERNWDYLQMIADSCRLAGVEEVP